MLGKTLILVLLTILSSNTHAEIIADNETLKTIYEQDQLDRGAKVIDWSEVRVRDDKRREQTLIMLRTGELRTAKDYLHAAMIMQHGRSAEDFKVANGLARISMTIDPSNTQARWLTAASWDRMLTSKNMPQWYGTQYRLSEHSGQYELFPIDETAVSDEDRVAMSVPVLQDKLDFLKKLSNEL